MSIRTNANAATYPLVAGFVVFCALAGTMGCNDGKPSRVPVSGVVLIDGKPLDYGVVRMYPASGGQPATGQIGPDGRFTMTTFELNDGAVVGQNQVEIRAMESISDTQSKWHAPKHYAAVETSELTTTISEPTDSLELKLTWEGGKPFVETFQ